MQPENGSEGQPPKVELVCPAGSLPSLWAAVDNGADAVYIGFRNRTNARNFSGLNFSREEAEAGIEYAHCRGRRVFVAVNTYPLPEHWEMATRAVDEAAALGADAILLADMALLDYAARAHPGMRRHLSVQGSATNRHAIDFYHEAFGISRAVLPRVLSLSQVRRVAAGVAVEVEVFAFGSLCIMVEGRCALSSYVTGDSPNTAGVCSPARSVRWVETPGAREVYLEDVLVDRFPAGEAAGYPTLCKGRYAVNGRVFHAIEEPTSLNVLEILPALVGCGVAAVKVEGRQRSRAYVGEVTAVLREALDACLDDPLGFRPEARWLERLDALSEGRCHTLGAYHRPWQ